MSRGFRTSALALMFVLCAGCKAGGEGGPVKVWADPALKVPLLRLAPEFGKRHPGGWEITFKETAEMRKLSAESHPDVALTVEPVAQELLKSDQFDESTMRTFAGDLLTVVTPRKKPLALGKVGDLIVTQFNSIAVGTDGTAEGYYGSQALIADGARDKIAKQTKTFDSVDKLVNAVSAGTTDFGLVFASTAAQSQGLKVATAVPEDLYEDIKYTAVASKEAAGRHGVMQLLRLLAEDEDTQKLWQSFGYLDRKTALEEMK